MNLLYNLTLPNIKTDYHLNYKTTVSILLHLHLVIMNRLNPLLYLLIMYKSYNLISSETRES